MSLKNIAVFGFAFALIASQSAIALDAVGQPARPSELQAQHPTLANQIRLEIAKEYNQSKTKYIFTEDRKTTISFELNDHGRLIGISIFTSSGNTEVDAIVVGIVQRASKRFPKPSAALKGKTLRFMLPIMFKASPPLPREQGGAS